MNLWQKLVCSTKNNSIFQEQRFCKWGLIIMEGTVLNMTQYVSMNFHGSIGKFSYHFSCTIFGGLMMMMLFITCKARNSETLLNSITGPRHAWGRKGKRVVVNRHTSS